MTNGDKQGIDIGMEYFKGIYTNTDIETKEAPPIFMLQRDTVKTFLHEKIGLFGLSSRFLGYIGIEITLIVSLITATFNDWLGLKGNVIEGTFVAFALIIGVIILRDGICCIKTRGKLSVDDLTQDLGSRGSIIKPTEKATSANE